MFLTGLPWLHENKRDEPWGGERQVLSTEVIARSYHGDVIHENCTCIL